MSPAAGDVGGPEWSQILGQMHELADKRLSHPNYDAALPRRHVLCVTGRLKGKAIIGSNSFKQQLREREEGDFLVWDIDYLKDLLTHVDGLVLSPAVSRELTQVLAVLASNPTISERDLEKLLAVISPGDRDRTGLQRSIFECSLIATTLLQMGLPFHALTAVLHEVRVLACETHHDSPPEDIGVLLQDALTRYVDLGQACLERFWPILGDKYEMCRMSGRGFGSFATYPLTCLRLMEYLGLSALICSQYGDGQRAERLTEQCSKLTENQPGCHHPLSDRSAASLAPAAIALAMAKETDTLRYLLRRTTIWLCDRVEQDFGIASAYSSPEQEIQQIFGSPFEFVALKQRKESLLACALADLSHVHCPGLYNDIVNDLAAVEAYACAFDPNK